MGLVRHASDWSMVWTVCGCEGSTVDGSGENLILKRARYPRMSNRQAAPVVEVPRARRSDAERALGLYYTVVSRHGAKLCAYCQGVVTFIVAYKYCMQ